MIMKKQIVRVMNVKTMVAVVLVALLFTANAASAQKTDATPALNVSFLGKLNDQPVFQLGYNNNSNEAYTITIKDAQGYVFFQETVKASVYTKKFMVDIPETEGVDLIITLTDKRGNEKQLYRLNGQVKETYDLSVTKL